MNYEKVYDKLYGIGYHDKGKNHGTSYATLIVKKFGTQFNNILELGCSNGRAVQIFHKNKKSAYGIDVSRIAISYAGEKFGVRNCVEGNVLDIPFKDDYFDAVFTCDMMEHLRVKDLDRAMKEIKRVTKKLFFIKVSDKAEENREHLIKAQARFENFPKVKNLHLTIMDITKWIKMIMQYGFDLIYQRQEFLVFKVRNQRGE